MDGLVEQHRFLKSPVPYNNCVINSLHYPGPDDSTQAGEPRLAAVEAGCPGVLAWAGGAEAGQPSGGGRGHQGDAAPVLVTQERRGIHLLLLLLLLGGGASGGGE